MYVSNSSNVSIKNGLAISYVKLGIFSRNQRSDMAQARHWFEKAEALFAELVKASPAYAEFQKNWQEVKDALAAL